MFRWKTFEALKILNEIFHFVENKSDRNICRLIIEVTKKLDEDKIFKILARFLFILWKYNWNFINNSKDYQLQSIWRFFFKISVRHFALDFTKHESALNKGPRFMPIWTRWKVLDEVTTEATVSYSAHEIQTSFYSGIYFNKVVEIVFQDDVSFKKHFFGHPQIINDAPSYHCYGEGLILKIKQPSAKKVVKSDDMKNEEDEKICCKMPDAC